MQSQLPTWPRMRIRWHTLAQVSECTETPEQQLCQRADPAGPTRHCQAWQIASDHRTSPCCSEQESDKPTLSSPSERGQMRTDRRPRNSRGAPVPSLKVSCNSTSQRPAPAFAEGPPCHGKLTISSKSRYATKASLRRLLRPHARPHRRDLPGCSEHEVVLEHEADHTRRPRGHFTW